MRSQPVATEPCPQCGEPIDLIACEERHRVHNGIGMQTVAVDRWIELDQYSCGCELTEDEIDRILAQ